MDGDAQSGSEVPCSPQVEEREKEITERIRVECKAEMDERMKRLEKEVTTNLDSVSTTVTNSQFGSSSSFTAVRCCIGAFWFQYMQLKQLLGCLGSAADSLPSLPGVALWNKSHETLWPTCRR